MTAAAAQWLTLQAASELLDVHPSTLRQWADRGRIRAYRTPGGHRRFAEGDVRALLAEPRSPELDLLLNAAVGRARLESSAGLLSAVGWYARFDESAKERHRQLGRMLMSVLVRYLAHPEDADRALEEARPIGCEYARLAAGSGLSLADSMRAFLHFQEVLAVSVSEVESVQQAPSGDLNRQVSGFVNEVLIAMVEEFGELAGT